MCNCAKFCHCWVCVTDLMDERALCHDPIHDQRRKSPSLIGLIRQANQESEIFVNLGILMEWVSVTPTRSF